MFHVAIITRRFLYLFKAQHSKIKIPEEEHIRTQNPIVLKSRSTLSFDKIDLRPKNGAIMVNIPEPDMYMKCEEAILRVSHDQGSLYHDSLYDGRPVDILQMLLHFGTHWIIARSCGRKWKPRDGTTNFIETDRAYLVLDVKCHHCLLTLIPAFSPRTYQLAANPLGLWYANSCSLVSDIPITSLW